MSTVLKYVAARAVEPSTWVGLGALVTAVLHRDPSSAFLAAGGILGVVLPEGASAKKA